MFSEYFQSKPCPSSSVEPIQEHSILGAVEQAIYKVEVEY